MSGRMSSRSGNDFKTPAIFLVSTFNPLGQANLSCNFDCALNAKLLLALSRESTASPAFQLRRRNIDDFAVNFDALVADELRASARVDAKPMR